MNSSEQTTPEMAEEIQEVTPDSAAEEETETVEDVTALPENTSEEPAEITPEPVAEEDTAEEDPVVPRLADEFLALAAEMEGITLPEDLPDEVWETAAQGVPLRDAYLRFWYAEHTRRQAAAHSRQQSAASATGSLRDLPDDPRPEEAAFARSFQTAVE